ncbi:MAG: hypothetical protein IAF58_13480, partial [Leptolyngbya sp.]|nr:hypothetical protein [Candidatus Melainabacteria bacterium]
LDTLLLLRLQAKRLISDDFEVEARSLYQFRTANYSEDSLPIAGAAHRLADALSQKVIPSVFTSNAAKLHIADSIGQAKISECSDLYRRAIEIYRERAKHASFVNSALVYALNHFARLKFFCSEYLESEELLLVAISTCEASGYSAQTQLFSSLQLLASVYRSSGRATEARALDQRADKIVREVFASYRSHYSGVIFGGPHYFSDGDHFRHNDRRR